VLCEARARPYDWCGSLFYLDGDFIDAALRQINRRADAGRRYCRAMARPAINTWYLGRNFRGSATLPCAALPRPKGEMSNESFSADRCRGSLCIDDNAHAPGRGDADVAAGSRRCANRRRYRSGARWPRSWSRAYGAGRSRPSLRLGPRPRASLWMVTWQTSRVAFDGGKF
jgi:hypothetical protein